MPDPTASAILSVEAKSLAAMRQVVALHAGKPRNAAPMLVSAIAQSRTTARREGARTMALEVKQALPSMPDARDLDNRYAQRAVAGYLDALDAADAKLDAGEDVNVSRIVTNKLELIAATEVPGAFGEERERIETRVIRDNPTLVPILLKRWNAKLDRACPVCRALDKTSRPWGIDFEGGQKPGRVHPRCRCYASYMPIPILLTGRRREQQRTERSVWEWMD